MNNKVTLQDLAEQLAAASGQSKKLSEGFLRALTEIVEDALAKDGIAKVKGLGTFKIIAIEERKSVSVTDGNAVIIPAHKKISFTPEKELKEAINKPYEHLETYVLPNDGPVDGPFNDEDEEDSEASFDEGNNVSIIETNAGSASANLASTPAEQEIEKQAISPTSRVEESAELPNPQEKDTEQPVPISSATTQSQATENIQQPTASGIETKQEEKEAEATSKGNIPETNAVPETPALPNEGEAEKKPEGESQAKEANNTDETGETIIEPQTESSKEDKRQEATEEKAEKRQPDEAQPSQSEGEKSQETNNTGDDETAATKETNETTATGQENPEKKEGEKEEPKKTSEPTASPTPKKEETKHKKNKNLLVVIIILIILILACLAYALKGNKGISGNFDMIKATITNLFSEPKAAQPDTVVAPTPKTEEIKKADDYFEETNADIYEAAQADQEFPEQVVTEQNWDWFDEEFKKFIKKEYPKINFEVKGEPFTDTIRSGQTLTSMSRKYYNGSKDFWVYIYLYNKATIRRPDDVPAGTEIKIPQLDESVINPRSFESINAAKDVKESYLRLFN